MTGRKVRLPCSGPSRQGMMFAILVRRIYPQRVMIDAFDGKRLRPGSTIAEADLWPTPEWPESPLLVEYAGSDRSGHGHRRSNQTYLLWRYDPGLPEWVEIARATAVGVEWVETLKSAALHCLNDGQPADKGAADGVVKILCVLESQLELLDTPGRQALLGLLYEQFMARLVRDRVPEKGVSGV